MVQRVNTLCKAVDLPNTLSLNLLYHYALQADKHQRLELRKVYLLVFFDFSHYLLDLNVHLHQVFVFKFLFKLLITLKPKIQISGDLELILKL
jgi:hypothetical protein